MNRWMGVCRMEVQKGPEHRDLISKERGTWGFLTNYETL